MEPARLPWQLVVVAALAACGSPQPTGAFGVAFGQSSAEAAKKIGIVCAGHWTPELAVGLPWMECRGATHEIWAHRGVHSIIANDATVVAITVTWPCSEEVRAELSERTTDVFDLKPELHDPWHVWASGLTVRLEHRAKDRLCRLLVSEKSYADAYAAQGFAGWFSDFGAALQPR